MASIRFRLGAALALGLGLLLGVQAPQSTAPKKSAPPKAAVAKKKPSARSKSKSKSKKPPVRAQTKPTPERYKQIEQALHIRGYLKEEPSGNWTPGAVEALRTFQADSKLPPTGRLDSHSLIALGLATGHDRFVKAER